MFRRSGYDREYRELPQLGAPRADGGVTAPHDRRSLAGVGGPPPPTGSRQLRRSKSKLFFVVAGRHRDGSGGSFASARSKTFWEGLDVYYYVGLRIQPSANVPVQPVSDSHYVGVNHRPAPTTC